MPEGKFLFLLKEFKSGNKKGKITCGFLAISFLHDKKKKQEE